MIDSQALLTKGRELPWVGVRAASFGTKMGGESGKTSFFLIYANVITVTRRHLILPSKLK